MNWRIKGIVQGGLSRVPGGIRLNTFLQQTLGDLRNFESNIERKVSDWQVFMYHMNELGFPPRGRDYLEVGTGWYPTLPICFSLIGARSFRTFDITRHLSEKLSFRMLRCLEPHLDAIARGGGADLKEVRARYDELRRCETIDDLLLRAGIQYFAPGDAADTALPDSSVDVVVSNSVLEHVPVESIRGIMKENSRVLRPGGLTIHSVNCADHYAYFDRSISPVNYLCYSEEQWRFWNNELLFQNRLRPQDFLTIAREAGFTVLLDKIAFTFTVVMKMNLHVSNTRLRENCQRIEQPGPVFLFRIEEGVARPPP